MSEPEAPGLELPQELWKALEKYRRPEALTPNEIEILKRLAHQQAAKEARWATFRANYQLIAIIVSALTTIFTASVTYIVNHLPASPK